MTNAQIADGFDQLADLLEFQGANPFRCRAYRAAARTIRGLHEPLAAMVDDPDKPLTDIEGIGDDLAAKIRVFVETGVLPLLEELKSQIPASVLKLLGIPGLGPKKVAALHRELKINTLAELRAACQAHRVRELKGFGAKTEDMILQGIDLAETAGKRLYWSDADGLAQLLRRHFESLPGIERLELAGSYRRGKDTVGDLDLLVVSTSPDAVMDRFAEFPDTAAVIARGDTKMSIRTHHGFQIDLRVVPKESFGAALQYFTGSKEHNVILRGRAKQLGLKINEYGVFRIAGDHEEYVAGADEDEVYRAVGLPLVPPELREGRREYEWADVGVLPDLLQLDDLQGDLHMHTSATDGSATLREMVDAAIARGHKYIAITDHSQRVSMARGLDATRLLRQWAEIDALNQQLEGAIVVLKGIECDILEKGGMDLPDDVLAQADWVLGSVHYGQRQPRAQITERILGALENPHVDAIAHPTGRLLNRREPYDVDLDAVFRAARQQGKLLELNAHPARLDLDDVACATAKSHGIRIVINTDAHSPEGLDMMRFGVLQARRAGLTRDDVANARGWEQFQALLAQRSPEASGPASAGR